MNKNFLEMHNMKAIFPAGTDLNTAAITGARVALSKFDRVCAIISVATSTAAVMSMSLMQHNAASSGTSKALSVKNPYYYRIAGTETWTRVEVDPTADTFDLSTLFNAAAGEIAFEVLGEDLDVNAGFTHFSVNIADSTAAKIGAGFYFLSNPRFGPAYKNAVTAL